MDTVIFVGRVVLVLDLWDSTEGRVTLVKVELVGATAGVEAACGDGGILRYVERVGDGNVVDEGDIGGEGACMDP